jgi:hypothetical protein
MVHQAAQRTVVAAMAVLALLLLSAPRTVAGAELAPNERPGWLTPNQLFGGRGLTLQEALAACGPAAAVAFANAMGRPVSLDRAVAVAREVGWTPSRGMSGPYGQISLLNRLNIPATIEAGINPSKIVREVQAGRPVIIRTGGLGSSIPGHYFVAERIDPASGQFDLAQSALVLRASGGRRWFSLSEIASLGAGAPTHAIFLAAGSGSTLTAASAGAPTPIMVASRRTAGTGSQVVTAGGVGAWLRATPGTSASIVGSIMDGTRVTPTGASAVVAGRTWKRVALPGGGAAWMDAGLLRSS